MQALGIMIKSWQSNIKNSGMYSPELEGITKPEQKYWRKEKLQL